MKTLNFILYMASCVLSIAAFCITMYKCSMYQDFQAGIWWMLPALFFLVWSARYQVP